MEFRILGPFEVVVDGQAVDIGGAKQRALLAVLLLHANRVVSTDLLIDALWGDRPPGRAQKVVQVYVSQLRKALGADRILTRAPGYKLHVESGELDLDRFHTLMTKRRPGEALSLWRGDPFADFAHEPFAQIEIARLEERRLGAVEEWIETQLEAGEASALVGELGALVRAHPLRERLCRQLMLALYRSDRQAEALETYQRTRRELVDQRGIEPGPALRDLERRILNHDDALMAPRAARPAVSRRRRLRAAFVAAAAVAAAALAATVYLVTQDSTGGSQVIAPNSVGVIDPRTGEVVAVVPVGIRPGPLAAGGGSVWVGNLQDRTLTRLDVKTRTAVGTVSLAAM